MKVNSEDSNRMNELANWFEQHEDQIPNSSRIIHKLKNDQQLGHMVNAEFAKRFHEDETYEVTDIEASAKNHDVDIELNKKINIQTWHGQSTAGHIMESQFDKQGQERNEQLGNISPLGGVKTDFDKDCLVMKKKLEQLPDDDLGIVLLLDRFIGVTVLPKWWDEIPGNKCVIKLNFASYDADSQKIFGNATVYHSKNFKEMEEVKKIISVLRFNLRAENIP